MKVCIFGANGRTGKEVVSQAVDKGYEVVSFVYNDTDVFYSPLVKVIKGDVMNIEDVDIAIKECDSVISVIGHIKGSDPLMQTKGIFNITEVMKKYSISRILSLTGTGVRFPGDKPSILDRIGNIIIKLIDRERIIDGINHSEVLKDSNLDWTILRVLKLSNSDTKDISYNLTDHGPAEKFTPRKKVAKILVDLLKDDEYIKKYPIVS